MKHFEELEAEVMTDPARRERVERERTKVVAEQVRDALGELRRQHTQVRSAERGSQLLQVGEPASGDGVDRRAPESGAVVSKHGDARRQRILVLFGERVPPPLELLGDEKLPGHRISIPSEGYTVNKMGHSPAEDVVLANMHRSLLIRLRRLSATPTSQDYEDRIVWAGSSTSIGWSLDLDG